MCKRGKEGVIDRVRERSEEKKREQREGERERRREEREGETERHRETREGDKSLDKSQ
jgi:hypothetical protein